MLVAGSCVIAMFADSVTLKPPNAAIRSICSAANTSKAVRVVLHHHHERPFAARGSVRTRLPAVTVARLVVGALLAGILNRARKLRLRRRPAPAAEHRIRAPVVRAAPQHGAPHGGARAVDAIPQLHLTLAIV